MRSKAKPTRTSRREFLKGAAVMGGAATLAVVARGGAAAAPQGSRVAAPPDKPKGYHVTPHIQQYYDKARMI